MEKELDEMIRGLSPEMQDDIKRKVEVYVKKLLKRANGNSAEKINGHKKTSFKFDWIGAVRDLRDKYTSVELQHDLLDDWNK